MRDPFYARGQQKPQREGKARFDLTATVGADQFDPNPGNNVDDENNGGTATGNPKDALFFDNFEGQIDFEG